MKLFLTIFLCYFTLIRRAQRNFFSRLEANTGSILNLFPHEEHGNGGTLRDSVEDGNIQRVVAILQSNIKQWSFIEAQLLEPNVNLGMPEIFIPLKHLTTTLEILGNIFFMRNEYDEAKSCLERACPLMELLPTSLIENLNNSPLDKQRMPDIDLQDDELFQQFQETYHAENQFLHDDDGSENHDGSVTTYSSGGSMNTYAADCFTLLRNVYLKLYGNSSTTNNNNASVVTTRMKEDEEEMEVEESLFDEELDPKPNELGDNDSSSAASSELPDEDPSFDMDDKIEELRMPFQHLRDELMMIHYGHHKSNPSSASHHTDSSDMDDGEDIIDIRRSDGKGKQSRKATTIPTPNERNKPKSASAAGKTSPAQTQKNTPKPTQSQQSSKPTTSKGKSANPTSGTMSTTTSQKFSKVIPFSPAFSSDQGFSDADNKNVHNMVRGGIPSQQAANTLRHILEDEFQDYLQSQHQHSVANGGSSSFYEGEDDAYLDDSFLLGLASSATNVVAADLELMLRKFVSENSVGRREILQFAKEYYDTLDIKFPNMGEHEYAANMDLGHVYLDVMERVVNEGTEFIGKELEKCQGIEQSLMSTSTALDQLPSEVDPVKYGVGIIWEVDPDTGLKKQFAVELDGSYFDAFTLEERNRLLILSAFDILLNLKPGEHFDLSLGFSLGIMDNDRSRQKAYEATNQLLHGHGNAMEQMSAPYDPDITYMDELMDDYELDFEDSSSLLTRLDTKGNNQKGNKGNTHRQGGHSKASEPQDIPASMFEEQIILPTNELTANLRSSVPTIRFENDWTFLLFVGFLVATAMVMYFAYQESNRRKLLLRAQRGRTQKKNPIPESWSSWLFRGITGIDWNSDINLIDLLTLSFLFQRVGVLCYEVYSFFKQKVTQCQEVVVSWREEQLASTKDAASGYSNNTFGGNANNNGNSSVTRAHLTKKSSTASVSPTPVMEKKTNKPHMVPVIDSGSSKQSSADSPVTSPLPIAIDMKESTDQVMTKLSTTLYQSIMRWNIFSMSSKSVEELEMDSPSQDELISPNDLNDIVQPFNALMPPYSADIEDESEDEEEELALETTEAGDIVHYANDIVTGSAERVLISKCEELQRKQKEVDEKDLEASDVAERDDTATETDSQSSSTITSMESNNLSETMQPFQHQTYERIQSTQVHEHNNKKKAVKKSNKMNENPTHKVSPNNAAVHGTSGAGGKATQHQKVFFPEGNQEMENEEGWQEAKRKASNKKSFVQQPQQQSKSQPVALQVQPHNHITVTSVSSGNGKGSVLPESTKPSLVTNDRDILKVLNATAAANTVPKALAGIKKVQTTPPLNPLQVDEDHVLPIMALPSPTTSFRVGRSSSLPQLIPKPRPGLPSYKNAVTNMADPSLPTTLLPMPSLIATNSVSNSAIGGDGKTTIASALPISHIAPTLSPPTTSLPAVVVNPVKVGMELPALTATTPTRKFESSPGTTFTFDVSTSSPVNSLLPPPAATTTTIVLPPPQPAFLQPNPLLSRNANSTTSGQNSNSFLAPPGLGSASSYPIAPSLSYLDSIDGLLGHHGHHHSTTTTGSSVVSTVSDSSNNSLFLPAALRGHGPHSGLMSIGGNNSLAGPYSNHLASSSTSTWPFHAPEDDMLSAMMNNMPAESDYYMLPGVLDDILQSSPSLFDFSSSEHTVSDLHHKSMVNSLGSSALQTPPSKSSSFYTPFPADDFMGSTEVTSGSMISDLSPHAPVFLPSHSQLPSRSSNDTRSKSSQFPNDSWLLSKE